MTKVDILRVSVSAKRDRDGSRDFTYQLRNGTRIFKQNVRALSAPDAMEELAAALEISVTEIGPQKPG